MVLSPSMQLNALNGEHTRPCKLAEELAVITKPTLSFEYFPPKTDIGMENLLGRLGSMRNMNPIWIDVTFGAGGSTSDRTLSICETASRKYGLNVMMHLTCTNMKRDDIDTVLAQIKSAGIRNILALRGDPPNKADTWTACEGGFSHAADLVQYIRAQYGDYFSIGVAGYPEGHADCESFDLDLEYLKAKVDAGADLIVTQLFYDTDAYYRFVDKIRAMGVTVPVFPGVMPITTYSGLQRMTTMCKVRIPPAVAEAVDLLKEDDQKMREYGIELAARMCEDLIEHGAPGVHIYTMNSEDNIREVVKRLGPLLPPIHTEWAHITHS